LLAPPTAAAADRGLAAAAAAAAPPPSLQSSLTAVLALPALAASSARARARARCVASGAGPRSGRNLSLSAATTEAAAAAEGASAKNFKTSHALPSWREAKAQEDAPAERVCLASEGGGGESEGEGEGEFSPFDCKPKTEGGIEFEVVFPLFLPPASTRALLLPTTHPPPGPLKREHRAVPKRPRRRARPGPKRGGAGRPLLLPEVGEQKKSRMHRRCFLLPLLRSARRR